MFEVALGGIVDDVLEAHIDGLGAELHREHLVRLVSQAVEEFRVDRCRFFPDQPCERGSFRAVSLARRAEASEQVHLKLRRLGEFVGRQFGGLLVEVVGDAHRTDRVRAGRARAHLVELVHGRQHRPLRPSSRHSSPPRAAAAPALPPASRAVLRLRHRGDGHRRSLFGRDVAARHHCGGTADGAPDQEIAAIHASRNLRRRTVELVSASGSCWEASRDVSVGLSVSAGFSSCLFDMVQVLPFET